MPLVHTASEAVNCLLTSDQVSMDFLTVRGTELAMWTVPLLRASALTAYVPDVPTSR